MQNSGSRTMQNTEELRNKFLDYLQKDHFDKTPDELYQPMRYILNLGGKRLRPIFLLMACNLFDDDTQKALPAALAIEIFHNFSLVHDDIMDEAPLRRGKPTVHSRFGLNAGILSGDVMLIYAYEFLLKVENKKLTHRLFELFNKIAIDVCEGQQYDMNFETSSDVELDDYIKMIGLKTAALIAGGLQIGALIGGASEDDAQHLFDFGFNLGIAFQLQDDTLDTFGDPEKFGKQVGGDIIQNKKTFLVLKALELATPETATLLQELLADMEMDEALKVERVRNIFKDLNIRDFAEAAKERYLQKAFANMEAINIDPNRKTLLLELAGVIMERET